MISTHLSVVSLRDLILVQAVHRHGSFNSAARAMHISPSGLSHQVQKVEQALGAPLFERGGRRVVPTAGGKRLLEQIDAVLLAAEHLQQAARAGETAFGGELRLGVLATLGPYLLPHLVGPFPQHFPGTRLSLSEGKPRGLLRRLHEGELDAVLAPPVPPVSGISMQPLFFEPWEVLLRADHPLAGKRSVSLDQLQTSEAILMAESHAADEGYVQDVSLEWSCAGAGTCARPPGLHAGHCVGQNQGPTAAGAGNRTVLARSFALAQRSTSFCRLAMQAREATAGPQADGWRLMPPAFRTMLHGDAA
jgi:LysR family hydrogen peroxide-inducible transcriptional activator